MSKKTWEDAYYDGLLGDGDGFCEELQQVVRAKRDKRSKVNYTHGKIFNNVDEILESKLR